MGRNKTTMGQTKGIAIRIDRNLLNEIENHKLSRNELVTKAIQSYLHPKTKTSSEKTTNKKQQSSWAKVEEESDKLKTISKKNNKKNNEYTKPIDTEILTDDLYNEIYSTIYNTEVTPLKKQIELKNDLIKTLEKQNTIMQKDKEFLFSHINDLENHIPKKHSWFRKKRDNK